MVKVSTTAKDKLSALMAEEGKNLASSYVSVGVESGGCSGLSYKMEFSSEIPENAELYEDNGVKVVVEKKSPLPHWNPWNTQVVLTVKGSVLIIRTLRVPVGAERVSQYNTHERRNLR